MQDCEAAASTIAAASAAKISTTEFHPFPADLDRAQGLQRLSFTGLPSMRTVWRTIPAMRPGASSTGKPPPHGQSTFMIGSTPRGRRRR
jgi:hypothetical protein